MGHTATQSGLIAVYKSFKEGQRFFVRDPSAGGVAFGALVLPRAGSVIRLEDVWISGDYANATAGNDDVPNVQLCEIIELARGVATGGNTTTLTATSFNGRYANDDLNGKWIIVQRAGVKLRTDQIVDTVGATFSLTLASGTAIAAADTFVIFDVPVAPAGGTYPDDIRPLSPMIRTVGSATVRVSINPPPMRDLNIVLPEGVGIGYHSLVADDVMTVTPDDFVPFTNLCIAVSGTFLGKGNRSAQRHHMEP